MYKNVKTQFGCLRYLTQLNGKSPHCDVWWVKRNRAISLIFDPDWGKRCVLHYLRRNALQKPQTRCSSGPSLPRPREQRRPHKHSGCVRRLPPLLLSESRPLLSLRTPSHRCWRTHYAATCDSQSCESPLTRKEGRDCVTAGVLLDPMSSLLPFQQNISAE